MREFLPFALPDLGEEEIAEVVEVLRSGWLTTGPKTKALEAEFAATFGGHAVAVNSGTAGLHLALESLGIGPGDEVILPTLTFTATAAAVRYVGAEPVLVDVEPRSLNIDPERIRSAITPRTKAILPVHFAGLACEMQEILAVARQHGLLVVEDAAHALPTTYRGEYVGSMETDASVFSFYPAKPVGASEGGMILTRHPHVAQRCRTMRLHGISRDAFNRYTSPEASWKYEVVDCGFKYNLSDLASAVALVQFRKLPELQRKRTAMAQSYQAALADLPLELPLPARDGDLHAWHLYVIRTTAETPLSREQLVESLFAQGVGCSVHYIPLHLQPFWRDQYALREEHFPVATEAFRRVVSLPLYTKMTASDQQRVIDAVRQAITQPTRLAHAA